MNTMMPGAIGTGPAISAEPPPAAQTGPLELLVIQPTPFCNLDCRYCYLPDRQSKAVLPLSMLDRLFTNLFASRLPGPRFTVAWHAGEPLVVGQDYFERAFQLVDRLRPAAIQIRQDIQTNGTLIDQRWCDLFRAYDVHIGLSLDGPAFLHDVQRRRRTGQGSLDAALRGLDLLQDNDIEVSVITVLTRASLDHPDEIYDFFVDRGVSVVGFNIEELEGAHRETSLDALDAEQAYRRFLESFITRIEADSPARIAVRELDALLQLLLSPTRKEIDNQQTTPGAILSVDSAGRLSTFSPELLGFRNGAYEDFIIGRIPEPDDRPSSCPVSFDALIEAAAASPFGHDVAAGVERCRVSCEYFAMCGGGAPANKYFETGTFASDETRFCRFNRKLLIDTVVDFLDGRLPAGRGIPEASISDPRTAR